MEKLINKFTRNKSPEYPCATASLTPEEFEKVHEKNVAELERNDTQYRFYTVEETVTYSETDWMRVQLAGAVGIQIPVNEEIRPGTKLLVIQKSNNMHSPFEGVYTLGEILMENKDQSVPEPEG